MNITALIIAAAALVCFLIEFTRSKGSSLTALGLAFLTVAFVFTFVVQTGPTWVIH